MPTWGILIALLKDGKPVLGINNQPALKRVFIGDGFITKRLDSFGYKVLKTRKCEKLSDAIVLVSSAVVFDEIMLKRIRELSKKVKMLEFSANCYSCAMLAEGNIDIMIKFSNFEVYDIAAHIPIISGAGGITTALDRSDALKSNSMISSGDLSLHSNVLDILAINFQNNKIF